MYFSGVQPTFVQRVVKAPVANTPKFGEERKDFFGPLVHGYTPKDREVYRQSVIQHYNLPPDTSLDVCGQLIEEEAKRSASARKGSGAKPLTAQEAQALARQFKPLTTKE